MQCDREYQQCDDMELIEPSRSYLVNNFRTEAKHSSGIGVRNFAAFLRHATRSTRRAPRRVAFPPNL